MERVASKLCSHVAMQGEMLDNIEKQVARSVEYVQGGVTALQVGGRNLPGACAGVRHSSGDRASEGQGRRGGRLMARGGGTGWEGEHESGRVARGEQRWAEGGRPAGGAGGSGCAPAVGSLIPVCCFLLFHYATLSNADRRCTCRMPSSCKRRHASSCAARSSLY